MPPRNLVRAFLGLYLLTGIVVLFESLDTVLAARSGAIHGPDRGHAFILGSLEILAALLFLIPRTMRWGAAGLLLVFLAAFAHHAAQGSPPWPLLVYGATVVFVWVHGVKTDYIRQLRG